MSQSSKSNMQNRRSCAREKQKKRLFNHIHTNASINCVQNKESNGRTTRALRSQNDTKKRTPNESFGAHNTTHIFPSNFPSALQLNQSEKCFTFLFGLSFFSRFAVVLSLSRFGRMLRNRQTRLPKTNANVMCLNHRVGTSTRYYGNGNSKFMCM